MRTSIVELCPSVHGEGDIGFVPSLVNIAKTKGFSAYVEEGSNRWPAVHRLEAAHLYRLALENSPAGSRLDGVADEGVPFRLFTHWLDLTRRTLLHGRQNIYFESTKNSISGKRIDICSVRNESLRKEEEQIITDAVRILEKKGAEIVDVPLSFSPDDYFTVSIYEFKAEINHYLSTVKGHTKMSTLSDIIEFNNNNSKHCLKWAGDVRVS